MSDVPHWFAIAVTVGAAARLTRLVTRDTITEPMRQWVLFNRHQRRAVASGQPAPPPTRPRAARARAWGHKLLSCDWCSGFWISAAVVAAYLVAPQTAYLTVASVFTLSYLVGWLAEHESPAP